MSLIIDLRAELRLVSGRVSVTARTPLLGATGWCVLRNQRQQLARKTGLNLERIDHMLGRYGSPVSELFDLLAVRPELTQSIEETPEYLQVEAVYATVTKGHSTSTTCSCDLTHFW